MMETGTKVGVRGTIGTRVKEKAITTTDIIITITTITVTVIIAIITIGRTDEFMEKADGIIKMQ